MATLVGTIEAACEAIKDAHDFVALENPLKRTLADYSCRLAVEYALDPMFGTVEDSVALQVELVLEEMRYCRKPEGRIERIRARLKAAIGKKR